MIRLRKKYLVTFSLAYIYIPLVIFLFGWTKFYIAASCCIALGYGLKNLFNDYIQNHEDGEILINKGVLVFIIVFFLMIGYYAGWGNFVYQTEDWCKHNAVMRDLVERSWPVYYSNGNEHSMLTYYIAQYLVPALVGKIMNSFRMAEIANFIWAEIGLILVYLNMIRILKIHRGCMQLFSSWLLIFFSSPLLLTQKILEIVYPQAGSLASSYHWVSMGEILLQYSSNYVMLAWVFPQALVIWLITLLFIEHKESIQDYIALMLPGILFGTLSFLGIVPLALGVALEQIIKCKNLRQMAKKVFSLSNLVTLGSFGVIMFLYFYGNFMSGKPDNVKFQLLNYEGDYGKYFIFCAFMVLLYAICILGSNFKNILYYLSILTLLILPLFKMGVSNDLVMRCSIPALFLIMIFIISYINDYVNRNKNVSGNEFSVLMLMVLLFIGCIHPMQELCDSIVNDNFFALGEERSYGTMENYANRSLEEREDFLYNYYSYDIDKNLFYNYIARRKDIS